MSKGRLEAFSDGVFAIVITLLILDVRPEGSGLTGWQMFAHDWHKILIFVLSFVMVGVYWISHHHMMHFIAATDRTLLWFNLSLLLVVVFIPYAAALMSASHADATAIRIYGSTLILINLIGAALWWYANLKRRLVHSTMPEWFAGFVLRLQTAPMLIYGLAIALASWQRFVSLALFAVVPAFFILPNPWLEKRISGAREAMLTPEDSIGQG